MNKVCLNFCMITHNRAHEALEVIRNVYAHVDRLIIIDGGSTDGTVEGLNKIDKNDKIVLINSPWSDNFPEQRQKYLDTVASLRDPDEKSWVIVSDSDEYFSDRLLQRLRHVCQAAEDNGKFLVQVRCRSVELDDEGNRQHENIDDYWKPLIYKWRPDLMITGEKVHEGFGVRNSLLPAFPHGTVWNLPDKTKNGSEFEILYEHRKKPHVIWERAHCRNFFIYGGGSNLGEKQLLWKPFREMIDPLLAARFRIEREHIRWHHYRDYLKSGDIDLAAHYWLITHMFEGMGNKPEAATINLQPFLSNSFGIAWRPSIMEQYVGFNYDGASEVREGALIFYTVWHKEKCPKELKVLFKENLGINIK